MSVVRPFHVRLIPFVLACVAVLLQAPTPALPQTTPADTSTAPGGFLESATTGLIRPKLAASVDRKSVV